MIQTMWDAYSKKMQSAILKPRNAGFFTEQEATDRAMHYVKASLGKKEQGCQIALYFLVDPSDGVILEAVFQVFGPTALIAAAEAACELLIGKNYDQARRLTADLIDRRLRDLPDEPAIPDNGLQHLNTVIEAIEIGVSQCGHLPLPQTYHSPIPDQTGQAIANWHELPQEEKLGIIEKVLDEEIRPYIELDEGGIQILELKDNQELIIGYKGSCTSCYSSVGSTLNAIQQIITSKVHPSIKVVPDLSGLEF
jgi:NifU-like protein